MSFGADELMNNNKPVESAEICTLIFLRPGWPGGMANNDALINYFEF